MDYRFLDCVRENIETFGLHWTVRYYSKRLNQWELRFWLTQAIK